MPYLNGSVTGHYTVLDQIRRFACGYGTWTTPTFSGAGNGAMTGVDSYPASVSETWTITCTDATTPGSELWSVVGSVSGAQASATTGVAYANNLITFLINAGGTDYAVSDAWSVVMTAGAIPAAAVWVEERWDTAAVDGEGLAIHELILRGQGLSGTNQIYVGIVSYQSVNNDYYNLAVAGFTGYVPGNSFDTQPGYSGSKGVPMWNQAIPFWLLVNGDRIALAAKIETVYEHFYIGRCLPYATPSQYPYPLVVGGMLSSASATRYNETTHSWPYSGGINLRFVDGLWRTPDCWPFHNLIDNANTPINYRDTGGEYGLLPIVLNDVDPNVFGELDGVFHISGFNNAVENTLSISGDNYLVMRNTYRTGFNDYIAMRLD